MVKKIRWIEFHSPVFHGGKNFTNKIEVKRHDTLKIEYHTDEEMFYLTYQNRTSTLPVTSAFIWEAESDGPIPLVVNEHKTDDKNKRSKAQVATPQSHVFEGRGQGKK